jgi:uncharacterized SAM-binding protein YcdF (DUF218 family)
MLFLAKKIISTFMLPLPISMLLILTGLGILLLANHSKVAVIFILAGLVLLTAFSIRPVPNVILGHLESKYPPLKQVPSNIEEIVVLGGGSYASTSYPNNARLGAASTARLIEGIRLYQQCNHCKLILSGGRVFGSPVDANTMNNVAVNLGVKPSDILMEPGSQDTQSEALFIKKMVHDKPFILVTSAYHMPRAMRIFKNAGMRPLAAPTQYLSKRPHSLIYSLPSGANLMRSDMAIHEYLGMAWSWIRR